MKIRHRWFSWRSALAAVLAPLFALAIGAGCSSFDEQQRKWVFQPSKDTWGGAAATDGMQEVWIPFRSKEAGADVRLNALWLPRPEAGAPTLLYLHGARWDVRSSAGRMRRMHELGFSVLGIDYRGFGQSTDALPSEASALEDARAAWTWLAEQHPGTRRFVFGHSLGGAIAVDLASQIDDADGLLLEGTFTSIADVLRTFKWGWLPVGALLTQRFDAAERIGSVRTPVLVVHGSNDSLIRPELGRALYERISAPKRFVLVEGGSHHNTNSVGQPLYRAAITELFGFTGPTATVN